jgi:hypothetical protein
VVATDGVDERRAANAALPPAPPRLGRRFVVEESIGVMLEPTCGAEDETGLLSSVFMLVPNPTPFGRNRRP